MYISGLIMKNSRNVGFPGAAISMTPPNSRGASVMSTGIGGLSASPGSAGSSTRVLLGAGGSRGGRLYARPPSSVGAKAASGVSAGTMVSRLWPTPITCPGLITRSAVIAVPSTVASAAVSTGVQRTSVGVTVSRACWPGTVASAR